MLDFWELLASWGFRKELLELEPEDVEGGPHDEPNDVEGGATLTIGAWAGNASLLNPERDVSYAKSVGLGRIDIIVNDHSKRRGPSRFDIRDAQKIATLAKMSQDAGLEVHLMSWITPHEDYLKEAGDILCELREKVEFRSVMWDAEEPQTLATKSNGRRFSADEYEAAGELFEEHVLKPLHSMGVESGVTGIRYAPTKALAPLCKRAHYWTPQNYATRTSKAEPTTVNDKGVATWEKKFGKAPRWVLGVAGYRQDEIKLPKAEAKRLGRKFYRPAEALTASLDGAAKHCDSAVIWALGSLRRSPELSQALKAYAAHERRPSEVDTVS